LNIVILAIIRVLALWTVVVVHVVQCVGYCNYVENGC